jgi:hypothetical protein
VLGDLREAQARQDRDVEDQVSNNCEQVKVVNK